MGLVVTVLYNYILLMKLRNVILHFVHNYMWIRGFPVYESVNYLIISSKRQSFFNCCY